MKIKNLIWSGCSFSAGSGFTSEPKWHDVDKDLPFLFAHPDLKKYFKKPYTYGNIKSQIHDLTFPILLGKKLNCEFTKNLAVAGMGHTIHTRRVFSYLMNNKDNLNFEETVVGIQLTSFQRNELVQVTDDGGIDFVFLSGSNNIDENSSHYLLNHWNETYSVLKALYDLLVFKGWCENNKLKIHFFGFADFLKTQVYDCLDKLDKVSKQINQTELCHGQVDFPDVDNLLNDLNIIELPHSVNDWSFIVQNYHTDYHFVPEGHEIVANHLLDIFKNQLKYE